MLKLKTLTMRNFLSIGNVTQAIRLDDHGLSLVLGHNSDSNGGITKNGAGKTALLQAISFAIYGLPLTKIKIDNLINNINQRGMLVTLDFELDGKEFRIERGRKPNILKFFVNGEEIIDMSRGENRETQDEITHLVGMSHNLFTHVVALNTYTIPFLRQRAADQREVSEELLGVTQISRRAEMLKKLMSTTKDSLRQEEANIAAAKGVNSRIEDEIGEVERKHAQWDKSHAEHVAELARQIEELSVIDFEQEKERFEELDRWYTNQRDLQSHLQQHITQLQRMETDLTRFERELAAVAVPANAGKTFEAAIIRLETEKARKLTERKRIVDGLPAFEDKIMVLQTKVDNPGEHQCATCQQPLEGTDHLKTVIDNLEAQMKELVIELAAKQTVIEALEEETALLEGEIADAAVAKETAIAAALARNEELNGAIKALKAECEQTKKAISDVKDRMASDEEKPQTLFTSRDDLYATKHLLDQCELELERERVKENPHVAHLSSLRGTLQAVEYDEINRLQELHRHQDFLMKLLTNKDSFVRKKIIDQNLHYLNTRLNFYLEKLGLPHEVVFQNDLTTEITLLGRDFDFEQLSRGEMNRVIMAVSWAFRDVWESLNHAINLIWVDELIDNGLDSQGAEAALAIMKSFSRNRKNVFLISHRDELVGRIDRTLLVSKDNGFTTIAEETS
jgi:DNA repair exonuclease SbcCD ATPase subunit